MKHNENTQTEQSKIKQNKNIKKNRTKSNLGDPNTPFYSGR